MNSESPSIHEPHEQMPNPFDAVMELVRVSLDERKICAECTSENKDALIAWYIREQERVGQSPLPAEGIELDIRAGVMQYVIAKDMGQRDEAFERLLEAKNAAIGVGATELAQKADRVMDMLDAI